MDNAVLRLGVKLGLKEFGRKRFDVAGEAVVVDEFAHALFAGSEGAEIVFIKPVLRGILEAREDAAHRKGFRERMKDGGHNSLYG